MSVYIISYALTSAALWSQSNAPSAQPAQPRPSIQSVPTRPSFKGVEVYSWQAEGNWRFAMLPGTNFIKPEELVIEECKNGLGLPDFKQELLKLPKGEFLIWVTTDSKMQLPPQSLIDELQSLTKSMDFNWIRSRH